MTFQISALSWLSRRCLSEMCQAEEELLFLKERLSSRWRCNVAAIRTLQANTESQKHTVLQRGVDHSEPPHVFGLVIKSTAVVPKKQPLTADWHPHTDNPHAHDSHIFRHNFYQTGSEQDFFSPSLCSLGWLHFLCWELLDLQLPFRENQ